MIYNSAAIVNSQKNVLQEHFSFDWNKIALFLIKNCKQTVLFIINGKL